MSQSRRGGSRKCSQAPARTSRKHSASKTSASSVESLSNYFIKKPPQSEMPATIPQNLLETNQDPSEDNNTYQLNSESPYKNLSKIDTKVVLNDSTSDAADFRSPAPARKPKNPIQKNKKTPVKKSQSKRGRSSKCTGKSSATKIITDNFKFFGDNPEHMQVAMALSKSSYEAECGSSSSQSPSKEEEDSNISEMCRNSKPAFLERFGFTSRRKVLPVENRRLVTVSSESTKRNRNRFKYITPILNIRTGEERNALIDSKITDILSQNNPQARPLYEDTVNSHKLTIWISKAQSVFNSDNIYQRNVFYAKGLGIPQHTYKCGRLLKDWNLIPGRDKSPCERKQDDSVEKDPADCKDQNAESAIRNKEDSVEETSIQPKYSESTSQIKTIGEDESPCKKLQVKHLDEVLSLGASCPSHVSTEIEETVLAFSKHKNDATPGTILAKSIVQSFNSSCRSMSPDLFGSDDEIDQQYDSNDTSDVAKGSISPQTDVEISNTHSLDKSIAAETDMHDSFENCVKTRDHGSKSSEKSTENEPGSETSFGALPNNEIIDLTDNDDNENLNKSSNHACPSDIEIITDDSDNCVSPHSKNFSKKRFSTPTKNIYNLDDFENDDNDKMESSPEVNDRFHAARDHDDKCDEDSNNEIGDSHSTKSKNNEFGHQKGIQENPIITTNAECQQIADSAADVVGFDQDEVKSHNKSHFIDTEIITDNETDFRSKYIRNSCNNSVQSNSSSTSTASRTESVDAYVVDDSLPDAQIFQNDFNEEQINAKQDTSPNNSPQQIQGYEKSFSPCHEADANDEKTYIHITGIENSSLEATPNRHLESNGVKSPCFDEPNLYDSTELNVTDYVNNMLKNGNLSFDQTHHINAGELDDEAVHVVDSEEEVLLSQESQSSVILDEELNYSSHYATPAKVNIEARRRYSYDDEIDNLDDVVPLTPVLEVQKPISSGLGTPILKEASAIETNNVPKAAVAEQTPTTDNFIVKTVNVTPMPEYDKMSTPFINKELQKVGVKPLKRRRGAKLLKYIYESTHPLVGLKEIVPDNSDSDEDKRVIKRRKNSIENLNNVELHFSNQNKSTSSDSAYESIIEIIGDQIIANEKLEDLVFERKHLAKIASCKVPLQIVWHNLVSSDQAIKEHILLYEPLQLESLHMMLKKQGFKFHMQDLLTFLDKKCITIRTAQKKGKE